MTLWLVIKDLHNSGCGLEDDFGRPTDHTSEVVAAFESEMEAEMFRDDMLNESEMEIYPYEGEIDPFTVYIDGIVESVEVNHGKSNEDAR